ncbi:MAG: CPBP family intramembrane metalloprotease [Proteobacteria bacterium]|nr:CPBP family intramembrane metalloprotease [Pseudomonadota bacterium]
MIGVLFIPRIKVNITILLITIIVAFFTKAINLWAFVPITILVCSSYLYFKKENLKKPIAIGLYLVILVVSIGLLMHKLPGFNNLKLIDSITLTSFSVPYTMWLNVDKPILAIIILLFSGYCLTVKGRDWHKIFQISLLSAITCLVVLIVPVILSGIIKFDPKLPDISPLWLINMLFIVCFAEEVFFRYFIQGSFTKALGFKYGQYIAIILSSLIFGLAHLPGGVIFALFAFIAGIFYGYSYYKTKSIECAILTHFMVNMTHFVAFTYPLAKS